MTSLYQPPLVPGLGNNVSGMLQGNHAPTKNPFFAVSNQFLPRNLADVIRWARFITTQSPVTTEVVRKLATYPITRFTYDAKDPAVRDKYVQITKAMQLRTALHTIGMQYHTVGNVFVSVYYPIHRSYHCKACGAAHASEKATFLKFKNYKMLGQCPICNTAGEFEVRDTKSMNVNELNLVTWDPLNIAVNHNPISGKSRYYYKIPNDIKKKVMAGDRLLLDSIPWAFVEAIKGGKDFEFDSRHIFHLKNVDAVGSIEGIAVPPLISHFGLVFYMATLRKANESIATDFMAPMRAVYPQAQTANSDPVVGISMRNFVANMQEAFVRHKQDNNHILIAPVPIGYQSLSGEGKTLLVSQEIQQAEQTLLLSMGVSYELLTGQTNWTSSTVGLRMLKNTLDSYVMQVEELLEWIFSGITAYMGLPYHDVGLVPFQLTDDDALKQLAMGLAQAGSMSMTTLYEALGRDYREELARLTDDAKLKARQAVITQYESEQAQWLAGMEINKRSEQDSSYQDVLRQAQELASQIAPLDPSTSQRVMTELKVTDYAKYLMVAKLVEESRTQATQQANLEAGMQAGQDPNAPGAPDQAQASGQAGPASQPGQPGSAPGGM